MAAPMPFAIGFKHLSLDHLKEVGGKNASLGELTQCLSDGDTDVPPGFALTTAAFRAFLDQHGLRPKIAKLLARLDKADLDAFAKTGQAIRDMVMACALPEGVEDSLKSFYGRMGGEDGTPCVVAVRSSATAEDLPGLSFAGQHDSFLYIDGLPALLEAVRRCYASLYTDRALSYRMDHNIDHMAVSMSVGIQRMIDADDTCAGVMFTLDPETGFRDCVLVSAAYGSGETVVQGLVETDEYHVHKATFARGHKCVFQHKLGRKHLKVVSDPDADGGTRIQAVPDDAQHRYCLEDREVVTLASAAIRIEKHYSRHYGRDTPMDVEWAKDGPTGKLHILQARPETVQALANPSEMVTYRLDGDGPTLTTGRAIGRKIASGTARYVSSKDRLGDFEPGDILVAETTSPDWEPVMKRAAAIITDHGGRTCHSAIVAREMGIPAIVGTGNATKLVRSGATVTVHCAAGETGRVIEGAIPFKTARKDIGKLHHPRTRIMLNIADPEQAFQLGLLPGDGVGLARIEFIITHIVGAHPMALLHPQAVTSRKTRDQLRALIQGHENGADFFVRTLAEGVAKIAAGFYPRPVIVRLSDFKSNEYAALLGGRWFEQSEDNPMIGFRGAARYIHPGYADAFALECAALKHARDDMGFTNIKIMVPFCRTLGEADSVLAAMAANRLRRGDNGLEIYIMCEIPSNILSIAGFARRFDGFSIGSNDLTQLTLGIDRDSALLAETFDERDPAVMKAITMAVEGAHLNATPIGICGQAPSDYPDFTRFLIDAGIDSISVSSDSFFDMFEIASEAEHSLTVAALRQDVQQ